MADVAITINSDVEQKHLYVNYEQFARIVIERWQYQIVSKRVVNTGNMLSDFVQFVHGEAGGNRVAIEFTFKTYMRYIDMGVGNGVRVADVRENQITRSIEGGSRAGTRRMPQKVYSPVLYRQFAAFARLQTQYMLAKGIDLIVSTITE